MNRGLCRKRVGRCKNGTYPNAVPKKTALDCLDYICSLAEVSVREALGILAALRVAQNDLVFLSEAETDILFVAVRR